MELNLNDVEFRFLPYFCAYKDGRVERYLFTDIIPPSINPKSGVSSKDIIISPESGLSARLFKPSITDQNDQKLPLVIYFHGGAFCFGSPFCSTYHIYIESLVAKARVVALSLDYSLAPEHPLPAAYTDAWAAVKWVASHCNGQGPEPWLDSADLSRVYLAGDSAGANIAHNTAIRVGVEGLSGAKLKGVCLVHLDVANREGHVYESWTFACPGSVGSGDPRINPSVDPNLSRLGCERVLVCVAEKDDARDRDWFYYESLKKSGWDGKLEIIETVGEGHVFHLFNPTCENAVALLKRMAAFVK